MLSTENKKPSRRKKVAAEAVAAAPVAPAIVETPVEPKAAAKKKAPAKKAAAKTVAKKTVVKKAVAKKAAPAVEAEPSVEAPVEPPVEAPKPKPARKAAPRKKKAEVVEPTEAIEPVAPPPPVPVLPVFTALTLQAGPESRLQWVAGDVCPPSLAELAAAALDAQGGLPAETAHDFVAALLSASRACGHPVAVAPEVWAQLACRRDAEGRVRRLEKFLSELSPESPLALSPQYQLEAALFAVSAGRALLADDLGLGQREAAVAALRLWREGFGLERMAVLASVSRHAAWRAALPEGVHLASDPTALEDQALDVLVVDAIEAWDIAALRRLHSTHLHLLANSEPLRDERLAAWVDWLDAARRGPLARLAALPPDAGARERREALQTLLLSRRKREFADTLPARLELTREFSVSAAPPADAMARLQAASARWQRLAHSTEAERAEVLAALQALRTAELDPGLLAAQAQALRELAEEWAPLRLRVAAEPAKRAALAPLLADRPELLAPAENATALVHLDLPWSAAALDTRYAALPAGRGLPVAWLLPAQGLSAALKRAPLPRELESDSPWWAEDDWAALMAALPSLVG